MSTFSHQTPEQFNAEKRRQIEGLTQLDVSSTLAHLHVAEHAIREEPYPRLPALAGALSMAQCHFEKLLQDATASREVITQLKASACEMIATAENLREADDDCGFTYDDGVISCLLSLFANVGIELDAEPKSERIDDD